MAICNVVYAAGLLFAASVTEAQSGLISDSAPRAPLRGVTPCIVVRIVDGDTIRCQELGLVRFIGIDAPEQTQPPFDSAATAGLAAMVAVGDTVQLEPDVEARDRYRRILAYVWQRGQMLNWLMLRHGWAVVLTYPPNVQWSDPFLIAQKQARDENRGLWAVGGFHCLPVDHRRKAC